MKSSIFYKFAKKVYRKIRSITFRLYKIKLQKDKIIEDDLESKMNSLNQAAEDYFQHYESTLKEELRKPFLISEHTPNTIIKLGAVLSELQFHNHLTVLDFGCGTGWLSFLLNRLSFNIIGLDVSKTSTDFAEKEISKQIYYDKLHTHFFKAYDGGKFPISDNSVHYIITFDSFHHVPHQENTLKEMYRVLVPGGKVILSEPGTGHAVQEETLEEVEKFGVLERDVNILDVEERAGNAGFEKIYLKPFYGYTDTKLNKSEYKKLFAGKPSYQVLTELRNILYTNPIYILEKNGVFEDSFGYTANVTTSTKTIKTKAGKPFDVDVEITNTGNRSINVTPHKNGGFITLGAKLMQDDTLIQNDFGERGLFKTDILPNETVSLKMSFNAPKKKGNYQLLLDLVNEGFYWLSEKDEKIAAIIEIITG